MNHNSVTNFQGKVMNIWEKHNIVFRKEGGGGSKSKAVWSLLPKFVHFPWHNRPKKTKQLKNWSSFFPDIMRLTCLFSVDWLKTSPAASSCTRSSLMPRTSFYAGRPHYHVCCTAITKTLKFCDKWNNIQMFRQPQWIAGLFYVVLCEATQEKNSVKMCCDSYH